MCVYVLLVVNGMDPTEAEDIKKKWQEYTEKLDKIRVTTVGLKVTDSARITSLTSKVLHSLLVLPMVYGIFLPFMIYPYYLKSHRSTPSAYLVFGTSVDFPISLIGYHLNDIERCQGQSTYALFRILNWYSIFSQWPQ